MVWYAILGLFVYQWGWMFGLLAYCASYNVIGLVLKATMNLEMMSGGDEFFF